MTISQIEALLTLATTLNYTKASAILHTTQPNLSKIIVNLEQEVGFQLLHRNKRDVKLTPAGKTFCQGMEAVLEQYRNALARAREVDSGIHGSLDVGILGTAMVRVLPQIVSRFREKHPDIRLNLVDYTYSRLMEALAQDKLDAALLPDRTLEQKDKVHRQFLFADSMCLVVHREHPLAARERIDLFGVREESFVLMDPKVSPGDWELVMSMCAEQEFVPPVSYLANTLNSLILMVECRLGVSVLAEHMCHFATENVRFVRLRGYEEHFRVSCAWLREANPCLHHFLRVLEECVP